MLYESKNFLKRFLQNKRKETALHLAERSKLILDVGCGDGFFLEKLNDAVGAELSTKEVRQKYERVRAALDELYWAIERLDR
jgi:SAM-dependent methyltransferase